MIKQNLHTHTSFSDGLNSMEEMVLAAIGKGFESLGFSEHAYAPYDEGFCIKKEKIPEYHMEFDRLKQKYSGQIELFLGFECDGNYDTPKDGLDYTIGSMHYAFDESTGEYLAVDYKHEHFRQAVQNIAGGEVSVFLEYYYDSLARFLTEYKPDIAGHMDLIKKLNKDNRYFDPESSWYKRIVKGAAEKIAETGCIVEVNTGGIFRGNASEPYPSPDILSRLFEMRVPVTVSSDSHSVDSLDFWFGEAVRLLKKTGYRSIKQLTADGFVDIEI